jgi:plasmid stability protein
LRADWSSDPTPIYTWSLNRTLSTDDDTAKILILTRLALCEIIDINDPMEYRMAGNLHVRNLDDDLIARLKRRAARHGRSTEAEHREILRQTLIGDVEPSFDTLAADLRKLTRRRQQTPSEVLLREGRKER